MKNEKPSPIFLGFEKLLLKRRLARKWILKNPLLDFEIFDAIASEYGVDILKVFGAFQASWIMERDWDHLGPLLGGSDWYDFVEMLWCAGIVKPYLHSFKVPLLVQFKLHLWLMCRFKNPFTVGSLVKPEVSETGESLKVRLKEVCKLVA